MEMKEMEEAGVIEPSSSEWASPIVLVGKKDGSMWLCIDFCCLIEVIYMDAYPMPHMDDLIDELGTAWYITTLDLCRGYWQVPVSEESRPFTAFVTPFGLFEFLVMPFGLSGPPANCQRLMDRVICGLDGFYSAYLDDVVIYSATWEEHLTHVYTVLDQLRQAALTAKHRKCQFGMAECAYLGHVVGGGEVKPYTSKVEAVASFTESLFLGTLGLPSLVPNKVPWTLESEAAFNQLKSRLCSKPIFTSPDFSRQFLLQTDASERGGGAVLAQVDDQREEHPVAYFSRKLLPREAHYSIVEKECLAIKLGVQAFRVYLLGPVICDPDGPSLFGVVGPVKI